MSTVRCLGTDFSFDRKQARRERRNHLTATTIYKDGLAFYVPESLHCIDGKVKHHVIHLINKNNVEAMIALSKRGVRIAKVEIGEAV